MKLAFLTGLLLGFVGLLVAAGGYPLVQHPRVASQTQVVPNGGRAERFLIRLPADRIGGFEGADGGAPVARPGLAAGVSIEQFKIRDVDGRVIGVAARHAADTDAGRGTAWVVSIPSRGTFMLGAEGVPQAPLEQALQSAGYVAGAAWEGNVQVDTVPSAAGAAQFSAGTAEFADLEIAFSESWTVTGVGADGALRGTVELATIGRRGT